MAIAFFDLDRTLISKNSGTLWIKKEIREGRLSKADMLRAAVGLTRYTLGFVDLEPLIRLAIQRLRGTPESELRARVYSFYDEEVRDLYRPQAREAVERHRRQGDAIYLLTSASIYLSERVGEDLELDGLLCNRFEVGPDGRFTGEPDGELCFGEGKLHHAEQVTRAADVPMSACTFYTDSMADISVMNVVGNPVAVHPDPRLRRIAAKRNWPTRDWGC